MTLTTFCTEGSLRSAASTSGETKSSTCTMAKARPSFSSKREAGDVDSMSAEQSSDRADDAGSIQVGDYDELSVEVRFDLDAVELDEARRGAVNDGAAAFDRAGGTIEFEVNQIDARIGIRRASRERLRHAPPPPPEH